MNGIIYCRVSSKEQIEGTSLESQQAACREYAQTHGIAVAKVFVEQGESAKFADRTQLIELINFCRDNKGKVQVLLVWKVDRFARNVGDHFNVKATLLKYGVSVVSVTEPIDSNPEGKLLETILAGFAQFDNDIRAMRTVQGMQRKLQEGIFPWQAPLGYRSAKSNGEKKTAPDMPDQPLFGLLQKAWQEFATSAYTKAEIRRLMINWGIHNRGGVPISNNGVDQLFRNPYYAGVLVNPWSGEEYEGKHIPMVSKKDFARVQQIVSKRSRSIPHQKERPEFPLRGQVRCPRCRQYMTGSFSRGRSMRYAYYHCNRPKCRRVSHSTGHVHEEFFALLASLATKPELIPKLKDLIVQAAGERLTLSKATQVRRKTLRQQLERRLRELIEMRADRLITDKEFLAHKAILDEKRFALENTPEADRVNVATVRENLDEIAEPLTHLPETWQALSLPFQRRFNRLVLPVGFVFGESGTAELGLIFRVFGELADKNVTGVPPGDINWNQLMQEIIEFASLLEKAQETTRGSIEVVPRFAPE